MITNQGGRR